MSLANTKQVDGSHYQPKVGTLQHWDWVEDNGLGYLEGCATKYICRCNSKHPSPRKDLEKAIHYLEKLIEKIDDGIRKPREYTGRNQSAGVMDICKAYELDEDIFEILFHIFYWDHDGDLNSQSTTADLYKAIGLIKEYIEKHDSTTPV